MNQMTTTHPVSHGRLSQWDYCIGIPPFVFCVFLEGVEGEQNLFLYQHETWTNPNSERFTNATTHLSTSKHIISLFRRIPMMNYSWDPISDAYCVGWQSLPAQPQESLGALLQAQSSVPSRDQPCALELLEQLKQFQWPQLWRQLFAHRLWWQKCVVGFPLTAWSSPQPLPHIHTQLPCHASCMHHHQRGAKMPHDFRTRMSNAPQGRTALYLVCKIIETEAVSSKSKPFL